MAFSQGFKMNRVFKEPKVILNKPPQPRSRRSGLLNQGGESWRQKAKLILFRYSILFLSAFLMSGVSILAVSHAQETSSDQHLTSPKRLQRSSLGFQRENLKENEPFLQGVLKHSEGKNEEVNRKKEVKRCPMDKKDEEKVTKEYIGKERLDDEKKERITTKKRTQETQETEEKQEDYYFEGSPDNEQSYSPFEAYVRNQAPSTISLNINQFGYDLFECPPTTFAPVNLVPVGPDYLLGPGDELMITIWGKVNLDFSPVIDSEGKIVLPEIGILLLSGLTFTEAKRVLEKEFSRFYRSSEVKMNISMGRLRSVRIFVVGQALWPGSYTLSSFSTLINALFAAGGPSKSGTMRDIQVKRNGVTVTHFDLYDFLLKGDKTKDIRLMPEDVIFIPPIGSLVGVVGNVKIPAIYELKGETSLLDLIAMAGGLNPLAFKDRVQLQRVQNHHLITLFESDLIDVGENPKKDFLLRDGDIVKIFPVLEGVRLVRVLGSVGNPGLFGITPGVTKIKDVITRAGGLLYYALHDAELMRVYVTQSGPQAKKISIDLKRALAEDPAHNIALESNDFILVKSVPEWRLYREVKIGGEVRFPGTYPIEKGESLSSLIERAGGFTDNAYLKGAVFTRETVRKTQKKHLIETVDRLEQQLLSGSAATIETAVSPEAAAQQKGALEQRRALLAKMRAVVPIGRMSIQLSSLESFKGSPSDISLEDQDTLFVPEKPSSVQVLGSVYNQGSYLYQPGMTIAETLKKSGGVGKDAEVSSIYVLKVDGTAISRSQSGSGLFGKTFMNSKLETGDTVVVPEKLDRIAWLREIKDVTQILANIALVTGVFIQLF